MNNVTVPFKCSACGVGFVPEEGGVCSACGKQFCGLDLYVVEGIPDKFFCKADLPPGARAKPMLAWFRRGALLLRRASVGLEKKDG